MDLKKLEVCAPAQEAPLSYSLSDSRPLLACDLATLREVVRAVPAWTESDARQLDQVLRTRVVDALVGVSDPADLAALHQAVRTLVPHATRPALRALDRDWIARWHAWADLLDARVAQLHARDPARVRHLRHVPQILELLAGRPGLTQTELGEAAGLGAPNMSRLLRVLVDHGLVERRQESQAKRVYLVGSGASVDAAAASSAPERPRPDPLVQALRARNREPEPCSAALT